MALQTLVGVIDGRVVGRGWVALRLQGVYPGRALPLAWRVRQGQQGHCPDALPLAWSAQGHRQRPAGAPVVLLGEGEGEGTTLQQTMQAYPWSSVVRTGSTSTVLWDGETCRCATVVSWSKPGTVVALPEVRVTQEADGPGMRLCGWAQGEKEPRPLSPTMASAEEAWDGYAQRFRLAPFFSAQKSRGFPRHNSPRADQNRRSRLFIAACFASLWIRYLGALWVEQGWTSMIHRRHRCDLSLCQLGLRLLKHFLNEDFSLPVTFHAFI